MAGPGDEIAAGAAGRGRLRASQADREQVIDTLEAAFVQGRLSKDELDMRPARHTPGESPRGQADQDNSLVTLAGAVPSCHAHRPSSSTATALTAPLRIEPREQLRCPP